MISVLFAAKNSIYKTFPDLDVWDEERNALNWPGGNRAIAHPPCRLFCALKHFSTATTDEKRLAFFAIDMVRKWGGVLEHPARSTLWKEAALPRPGTRDEFGISIAVDQFWWGHRASKPTWLYVCAVEVPEIPFVLGYAPALQSNSRKANRYGRKLLSRQARSATPRRFAQWLIDTCEGRVMNGSQQSA